MRSSRRVGIRSASAAAGWRATAAGLILAAAATGVAARQAPLADEPQALVPEQVRLSRVSPTLMGKLRTEAFTYFRFINRQWAGQVCDAFAADLGSMPRVRLHGDAHIGQYALTATEYGLDDFDDSAFGPSVVDLVRFLSSVDLGLRGLSWEASTEQVFDRFFDAYRRGLRDPDYLGPVPSIVTRLRSEGHRSNAEFLDWAESLMRPLPAFDERLVRRVMLRGLLHHSDAWWPAYFQVKRLGAIHMGVGSALTNKLLIRIEGETADPNDDIVIEAKALNSLAGVACLQIPRSDEEVFRVIQGAEQIGRLHHKVLATLPSSARREGVKREWWLKSWEPTYREVLLTDIGTPEELAELVADVGGQLGSANLPQADADAPGPRRQELAMLERLEPKIRAVSRRLVDRMIEDWTIFAASDTPR